MFGFYLSPKYCNIFWVLLKKPFCNGSFFLADKQIFNIIFRVAYVYIQQTPKPKNHKIQLLLI